MPHRRSIRLPGYDYSQAGAYFITLCTQDHECCFGQILDGCLQLNNASRTIERWWHELSNKFPSIETDEYVVMPNHFHGVIAITGNNLYEAAGADPCGIVGADTQVGPGQSRRIAPTLGDILQWFKTMTTNEYIRGVKQLGWLSFQGRLWQRNYYEHIVRNEDELNRIRQYILDNPAKWMDDEENPANGKTRSLS